ncbi:MAG: 4Fe-4S dicluster domain-containing protein [Patescibacteria group bacterium]|jgi:ferredoxin
MTTKQLAKFLEYLAQQNIVWAPQRIDGELVIEQVTDPKKVELTSEMPLYSFKQILVPPEEVLFNYQKNQIKPEIKSPSQVIFGLTIPDLKAVTFLNQVFAQDPYFQNRIKKTIIVGHSLVPTEGYQFFINKFAEDILEHLKFDIFFAVQKDKFIIYAGSEDGQKVLDDFGYKNYQYIEYAGPIREEGPDGQMLKIREKFYQNKEIWQELGNRCIECGKCTLVCPTCFCYNIFDQPEFEPKSGQRRRFWTTCFYTDFSEVAGTEIDKMKPKFLKNTSARIRFWYEHKFVRCPDEFQLAGCVGCGRCTKVCPVGIDIKETLQKILKGKIK